MAEELPPDDESRPRFRRHSAPDGWLREKLEASDKIRSNPDLFFNDNVTEDALGARRLGGDEGITASYTKDVHLPPEMLIETQGSSGEGGHRGLPGNVKLEDLRESIAKEGYNIEGRPILVKVREDGTPFVVEGNHRLFEAWSSNRPTIPVSLQYKRGGEEAEGPLSPGRIERLGRYTDDALLSLELSKLSEEAGKSEKGVLSKGVGSLMRRSFPGLAAQAAQLGYKHLLSDEQREGIKNFLDRPLTETSGLEYLKEKLGISDDDLPMDTKSRQDRMHKMGFNIDALHGTTVPDETAWDPEGTVRESFPGTDRYPSSYPTDLGDWFTENPDVANHFAQGDGGHVLPVKLRLENPAIYPDYEALEAELAQFEDTKEFREWLQNEGFDGIKIEASSTDVPISREDYVTFDNKNIRSRFARFDPRDSDSGDISKANGGFVDKPLYDNPRGGYI